MQSPEQPGLLTDRNLTELSEQSWTLCDNLLPQEFFETLLSECLHRESKEDDFRKSQIGKGSHQQTADLIRNDLISWVDFDQTPGWNWDLQQKLDQLKAELNRGLYLGINTYECHFAKYPPGSFYKTHIDQSKHMTHLDSERVISFVLYLNKSWNKGDGGELQIEMPDSQPITVEPLFNRMILFRSDTVPHGVLESKIIRRSLTGWMRKTRVS